MPLWWSLALGACLGGNSSAIGASANVIVLWMAEKAGKKISFMKFMAYGMPIMIMTVIISTIYVWLRYYVFKIGLMVVCRVNCEGEQVCWHLPSKIQSNLDIQYRQS